MFILYLGQGLFSCSSVSIDTFTTTSQSDSLILEADTTTLERLGGFHYRELRVHESEVKIDSGEQNNLLLGRVSRKELESATKRIGVGSRTATYTTTGTAKLATLSSVCAFALSP